MVTTASVEWPTARGKKLAKKSKRPLLMAVVDEDNCTGCQVCIPFCPVDCIEPVPIHKYGLPVPPVQVRFHECIGCQICARVCGKLTWDAIRLAPIDEFEHTYGIHITDRPVPQDGSLSMNRLPEPVV
ncbi:MAG: 4Fe-4S binding protein [Candidatus Hydrogenedentes bacterium]|nr:4Fe-4S binding protein [Candidatus Hydrogenedentota bacterium]